MLNGFMAVNNSYAMAPKAQMSIFSSYLSPTRIYGERYKGVPHKVYLSYPFSLEKKFDSPKSQIFGNA